LKGRSVRHEDLVETHLLTLVDAGDDAQPGAAISISRSAVPNEIPNNIMYFCVIEAIPNTGSEAAQKYGGGHIACWINSTDWGEAKARAVSLVSGSGWTVKRTVEEKEVSAESYTPGDPAVEHLEQALTDNEVCVFYTFPKEK
jgi:hypothetical protein